MNQMATLKARVKRNTHKKEGRRQQKPLTPPAPPLQLYVIMVWGRGVSDTVQPQKQL